MVDNIALERFVNDEHLLLRTWENEDLAFTLIG